MLSVLAGASLLALAGAANASEPVTLTSAELDGVTAGSGCRICAPRPTYFQYDLVIFKMANDLEPLAKAEASATANGYGVFVPATLTLTSASIDPYKATSKSTSLAGLDY
jgi:hypothetical protein